MGRVSNVVLLSSYILRCSISFPRARTLSLSRPMMNLMMKANNAPSSLVDIMLVDFLMSTMSVSCVIPVPLGVVWQFRVMVLGFPIVFRLESLLELSFAWMVILLCLVRPVEDDKSSTAESYPRG